MFFILSNTKHSKNLVVPATSVQNIEPWGHSFVSVSMLDGYRISATSVTFAKDEAELKDILSDVDPRDIKHLD